MESKKATPTYSYPNSTKPNTNVCESSTPFRKLKRVKPAKLPPPCGVKFPTTAKTVCCDVVTPFCQADERYLFTSAYSILCQVGANVTLHVVADGFEPSDETKRLAEEFENLKLYRNEKVLGPYLSVMRIFHNFKTDFFAIQDADDYSLPHRIWHAVTTLQRTGYDLFGTG